MKKYILILSIGTLMAVSSCQSNNRSMSNDGGQDTTSINQNRGTTDDQYGNDSSRQNMNQGQGNLEQMDFNYNNVPTGIRDAIDNDGTLQGDSIRSSRSYSRDGNTYYEFTFGQDTAKVIFDERGTRQPGGTNTSPSGVN